MYVFSNQKEETLHKTSFISLFVMCTFYQYSTFSLLMSKETWMRKGIMDFPIFSFTST